MTTRIQVPVILALVGAGLIATVWGLTHTIRPGDFLLWWDLRDGDMAVLAAAFVACWCAARWLPLSPIAAGAFIGAACALLSGNGWALLVVLLVGGASFVIGRRVLGILGAQAEEQSATTHLLVGLLCYGTLIGISAHFAVAYVATYAVAVGLPLVFGWKLLVAQPWSAVAMRAEAPSWIESAIVALGLYHLLVAFMPEVGHDALVTHLFVPAHMALRHRWEFDVQTYAWAVMPMLGDWLYSLAYVLAGESGARLLNLGFVFVICRLITEFVRWAGGDSRGAKWAVLLFLSTPLTFTESSSLFIESVWAAFVLGGTLLMLQACHDAPEKVGQMRGRILASGLLLGGALAAKAVTFTTLPALCIPLAVRFRNWARRPYGWALLGALAAGGVFGLLPYARAWFLTKNPVFPFFNDIFRSPYWPAVAFDPPAMFDKGVSWDVLYRVTFDSSRFLEGTVGASGFQWLLCVLPAFVTLAVFKSASRALWLFVLCAVSVLITFHSTAYLRYVFPAFAWAAAGVGCALAAASAGVRRAIVGAIAVSVALNVVFFHSATYYGELSIEALSGPAGRESYLRRQLPIRNVVGLLNTLNTENDPVAVFAPPLMAGLAADALYANWYNTSFEAKVAQAHAPQQLKELLISKGVRFLLLDEAWPRAELRNMVRASSARVAQLGTVDIREISNGYGTELLPDAGSLSLREWQFPAARLQHSKSGELLVSVDAPAFQIVPVTPRRRYLVTVTARCPDGANEGRIQVNWLDQNSAILATSIQVFQCSAQSESHSAVVSSPPGVVQAAVYATGHTARPIIITGMSFRK